MGDSTAATAHSARPRKSTMSKIGRVFGFSSTSLAHEAQQHHQDTESSDNYDDNNHILSSQESLPSFYDPQPQKVSGTHSPLLRSRPQSPSSGAVNTLLRASALTPPNQNSPHVALPHSHSQSNLTTIPSRQSSLRVPQASAELKKSTTSSTGSGTSTLVDRLSPTEQAESLRPVSSSLSRSSSVSRLSSTLPQQRFVMLESGAHEHHLKNAKRQEKIGHMIKDLLGAKKLRSELVSAVPNILSSVIPPISENASQDNVASPPPQLQAPLKNAPPTLLTGLINQVKRGEITQYSGGHVNPQPVISLTSTTKVDSRSFVEKYGRCQEVIGRGAFGVVRVSHKKDKTSEILYAVKEFKRRPQESDKKYSRRLTSEFCISSSLQHVNIIHTLDLLQDLKGDYCEVMEFCSGGDLYSLIITLGKLEYIEADCFFKQLMRGVAYMHEMGVAHRDLKPENLLLTANGTLKITDFGNSELFRTAWETDIHLSGGICGSSPYIAPEEYTASEFDPRKVDIWSCGVIYMAMRTGRQLWKLANIEDEFYSTYLEKRKDAKGYEPIENLKRARCRNVIYSILDPVPSRRITSKQILNSEWCREIKLCSAGEGK